jgi:hypothetical protein
MKQKKKASIMPDFTVNTILLVLGFVILLISIGVIAYIVYVELIQDTTCEDSIIIRHSINLKFLPVDRLAPLTCTTKKLCLTQSGEGCNVFSMYTKDDYLFNRRITAKEYEEAKNQVIDKIIDEMYNCQNLFTNDDGDAYEFMPPNWFSSENKYCLVCSRIVLDEEARKNIGTITYGEFYQRLSERKLRDGRSYLDYIYPGWQDWRRISDLYSVFKEKYPDKLPDKFEDWKIDLSNERGVSIVAQMTVKGHLNALIAAGSVLGGTALAATYIGAPAGIALIGSGVSSGVTFWYSTPDEQYKYSPPAVYPGDVESLKSLGCSSIETAP